MMAVMRLPPGSVVQVAGLRGARGRIVAPGQRSRGSAPLVVEMARCSFFGDPFSAGYILDLVQGFKGGTFSVARVRHVIGDRFKGSD